MNITEEQKQKMHDTAVTAIENHPSILALRDELDVELMSGIELEEGDWHGQYSVRHYDIEYIVDVYLTEDGKIVSEIMML